MWGERRRVMARTGTRGELSLLEGYQLLTLILGAIRWLCCYLKGRDMCGNNGGLSRDWGGSVATGTPAQMVEHLKFDNNVRIKTLCTFEGLHFRSQYTILNSHLYSAAFVTS